MRRSFVTLAGALGAAIAIASLGLVPVAGQTSASGARAAAPVARPAAAKPYSLPRTADGKPDLQGVYDTSTITPLERPTGTEVMSEEEARKIEQQTAARKDRASLPSNANRQAPPVGGDGSSGAAGNVGGYNNFWIDSGDAVVVINGQRRRSIVVDPPTGRVPPTVGRGRGAAPPVAATPTSDAAENVVTAARGAYDNPEQRPLGERCLLGFGSTSGPPALPVLYNNFKQIVQTPEYVMILTEMNHDARIVRMNQPHRPSTVTMWLGDPIGRWEGDTLVVETTNFNEKTRFRGASTNLKVTERFSRLDDKTLLYRFTVEDRTVWATPWTGEYTWRLSAPDDHLYEYACHEGNYALGDILRGERLLEKEAVEAAKQR